MKNNNDTYIQEDRNNVMEIHMNPTELVSPTSNDYIRSSTTRDLLTRRNKNSSKKMTIFNIINTIIGGGIIVLPYCMSMSGLASGLLIIAISAIITHYSLRLLIYSSTNNEDVSYTILCKKAFGNVGYVLLSICQFLFPYLGCISYGMAIIQNFSTIFSFYTPEWTILNNRYFLLSIPTLLVMYPLSIFKHISFLDRFSSISMIFVAFYIIVIITKSIQLQPYIVTASTTYEIGRRTIIQSFGILAFAFGCQQNIIPIYKCYSSNNYKSFMSVISIAIGAVYIVYILIAVTGFVTFSGSIRDNLFFEYCSNDHLVNAAKVIFAITLMLTFPMQMYASREVLITALSQNFTIQKYHRIAITTLLVTIAYLISSSIQKLGPAVELAGSLTAAPLSFIFPPLIYLKLRIGSWKITQSNIISSVICWIMIVFGFCVMLLGSAFAINDIIKPNESNSFTRYWCTKEETILHTNTTFNYEF